MMEADPSRVQQEMTQFKAETPQTPEEAKASKQSNEGFIDEDILDDQVNVMQDFRLETSTSSCHIDDVTAFVVGGTPSRWWMMRKHINLMTKREMNEKMPFYSW